MLGVTLLAASTNRFLKDATKTVLTLISQKYCLFGYVGRSEKDNKQRQNRYLSKQNSMLLTPVVSVKTKAFLKTNSNNENQTA